MSSEFTEHGTIFTKISLGLILVWILFLKGVYFLSNLYLGLLLYMVFMVMCLITDQSRLVTVHSKRGKLFNRRTGKAEFKFSIGADFLNQDVTRCD
jgi:hypothetical protein